ncbi:MAG: integration host factor subunit alpha [Geminicoccaceae bacterium]
MKGKTLTRAHLAEAVYQEVGLSRSESAQLVDSILSEIGDSLARDGIVKISSFGTFSVRSKGQRIGRNPKTGEEVPILPRRVLVFRPSQVLKERINGGENSSGSEGAD